MAALQLDHERSLMEAAVEMAGGEFDTYIIGETDDELDDFELPPAAGKVGKIKSFHFRPAWKELDDRGLCAIPCHIRGCSMSYHSTRQAWQGYYPGGLSQMSFSWGGTTNRSEREAILASIRGVLASHVASCPRDKMWKQQLEKVKTAEAKGIWLEMMGDMVKTACSMYLSPESSKFLWPDTHCAICRMHDFKGCWFVYTNKIMYIYIKQHVFLLFWPVYICLFTGIRVRACVFLYWWQAAALAKDTWHGVKPMYTYLSMTIECFRKDYSKYSPCNVNS